MMESVACVNINTSVAVYLPLDILRIIIDQPILEHKDLKTIRLVCRDLRKAATPRLFAHITMSLYDENIQSLNCIVNTDELVKHVKTIKFDNTLCYANVPPKWYCYLAQKHFEKFLGHDQVDGPLSETSLVALFTSTPDNTLGDMALDDPLRDDFVRGYSIYNKRANYRQSLEYRTGLSGYMQGLFATFTNATKVQLYNNWEPSAPYPQLKHQFKEYLIQNLNPRTTKLIPGLTEEDLAMDTTSTKTPLRMYAAPGIAARSFNPIWLPPSVYNRQYYYVSEALVTSILDTLSQSPNHIKTLELPADAITREETYKFGEFDHIYFTHPAILVGRALRTPTDDCLVSAFTNLKYLTLKLDAVAFSDQTEQRIFYNATAITRGIQALKNIEQLFVSFRLEQPEDHDLLLDQTYTESWSMGRLFLSGLAGQMYKRTFPILYKPIPECPWPNLRILHLGNMIASWGHLDLFFKTIAPSLEELVLWHIRLEGSCKACQEGGLERVDHAEEAPCMDWIDVAVSLRGILSLRTCSITLSYGDFQPVRKRMGWEKGDGREGQLRGEVDGVLGKWVVGDWKGEGDWELMEALRGLK